MFRYGTVSGMRRLLGLAQCIFSQQSLHKIRFDQMEVWLLDVYN